MKQTATAKSGDSSSNPLASAARWVRKELKAARPVFLFFFCGFMLVLLIVRLALAQYSIEVGTLSRALIGALVAAKVVLILDETGLGHAFSRFPRIVPIIVKSVVYGLGVLLLGLVELVFDAYRHSPSLGAALTRASHETNLHRLLSIVLGTTLVFGIYFLCDQVGEQMEPGGLRVFLLTPEADSKHPAA